jgi:hypothetical protein
MVHLNPRTLRVKCCLPPEGRPSFPADAVISMPGRPVPAPSRVSSTAERKKFVMELGGKPALCVILKLPERGHFMPQDFLFQICHSSRFIAHQDKS